MCRAAASNARRLAMGGSGLAIRRIYHGIQNPASRPRTFEVRWGPSAHLANTPCGASSAAHFDGRQRPAIDRKLKYVGPRVMARSIERTPRRGDSPKIDV